MNRFTDWGPLMSNTVERWRRVEIELTSTVDRAQPDTEVSICAEFTAADGTVVRLPGFWDGGRTWRVRFAPPAVGTWTYRIISSDEHDPGLHDIRGAVHAIPYSGELPIYRHGFVRISDDHRAFTYADGTPFFWLGDTHWQAPNYERLHECNCADDTCTSQFHHAVDEVVAQGFTVYQTYPDAALNDGGGNRSQVDWWAEQYTHLDPLAFARQFDVMMDHLADRGLVIALGMGVHWTNGAIGTAALTHFAAHVAARYAAHPVVWITAQEVDVEHGSDTLPVWKAVAETIDTLDGYDRPLSAHMDSVGEPTTFGTEPWHDWFATQGGHGTIRTQDHYRAYWDHHPVKPFLETEANYEGIAGVASSATRRSAWTALQCGSFGFTNGSAGVWAMKWDDQTPGWDDYQSGISWLGGLHLPERKELRLMRDFYEGLGDWQSLRPRFGDPAWGEFEDPEHSVLSASDDHARVVVYFSGASTASGVLTSLDDAAAYSARWFDPRTGDDQVIARDISAVDGRWAVPAKPDADDWVLLVERH